MRKPVFGVATKCDSTTHESLNIGYNKYRYYTVWAANNKGADQTARIRRLICVFVVRIWNKQVFSITSSIDNHNMRQETLV